MFDDPRWGDDPRDLDDEPRDRDRDQEWREPGHTRDPGDDTGIGRSSMHTILAIPISVTAIVTMTAVRILAVARVLATRNQNPTRVTAMMGAGRSGLAIRAIPINGTPSCGISASPVGVSARHHTTAPGMPASRRLQRA